MILLSFFPRLNFTSLADVFACLIIFACLVFSFFSEIMCWVNRVMRASRPICDGSLRCSIPSLWTREMILRDSGQIAHVPYQICVNIAHEY